MYRWTIWWWLIDNDMMNHSADFSPLLPDDAWTHHPVNPWWCIEASFGHPRIGTMIIITSLQSYKCTTGSFKNDFLKSQDFKSACLFHCCLFILKSFQKYSIISIQSCIKTCFTQQIGTKTLHNKYFASNFYICLYLK